MAGKRKKHSRVGAYGGPIDWEKSMMETAEVLGGAAAGGAAAYAIIKNVPEATIKNDYRDALIAAVGVGLAILPESYGGGYLAKGAGVGMAVVSGLNLYLRHYAAPGIGARHGRYPHARGHQRVAGPGQTRINPVLAGPGQHTNNPVYVSGAGDVTQAQRIVAGLKQQFRAAA